MQSAEPDSDEAGSLAAAELTDEGQSDVSGSAYNEAETGIPAIFSQLDNAGESSFATSELYEEASNEPSRAAQEEASSFARDDHFSSETAVPDDFEATDDCVDCTHCVHPGNTPLPVFVRDEANQYWLPIAQLSGPMATTIVDRHATLSASSRYCTMLNKGGREIHGEGDALRPACLDCIITARNRWFCNTSDQLFEACDRCLDAAEYPCGRLIHHPTETGRLAIGYLPLSVHMRIGVAWTEVAFWIRPLGPAWTMRVKQMRGSIASKNKKRHGGGSSTRTPRKRAKGSSAG